jgi:hypothetical protein
MVYFSHEVYRKFVERLDTIVDMSDEVREQIKAHLCEVTKFNPSHSLKLTGDDPVERQRVASRRHYERNLETIRENKRIYMRNKRAAQKMQEQPLEV